MTEDPERFRKFDASNGWGTLDQFLPWLKRLRNACDENENAKIKVSR